MRIRIQMPLPRQLNQPRGQPRLTCTWKSTCAGRWAHLLPLCTSDQYYSCGSDTTGHVHLPLSCLTFTHFVPNGDGSSELVSTQCLF